jgi:hypothetical protein
MRWGGSSITRTRKLELRESGKDDDGSKTSDCDIVASRARFVLRRDEDDGAAVKVFDCVDLVIVREGYAALVMNSPSSSAYMRKGEKKIRWMRKERHCCLYSRSIDPSA